MAEVSIRTRSTLATIHLKNAKLFRDRAKEIESIFRDDTPSNIPQRKQSDHRAFCFNTILSAVSFVEATANEFVDDIREDKQRVIDDREPHFYPEIDKEYRDSIVSESNLDTRLRNASPPIKFNVLLDVMALEEYDREQNPLEPVLVLNRLRNELTHHSPEWVEGGPKEYTEDEYGFEEDIQGRFDLNPITAEGNAFFPTQCMSYGCADWAIQISKTLIRDFGRKTGVDIRPLFS